MFEASAWMLAVVMDVQYIKQPNFLPLSEDGWVIWYISIARLGMSRGG